MLFSKYSWKNVFESIEKYAMGSFRQLLLRLNPQTCVCPSKQNLYKNKNKCLNF